ncbi:MAG: hypothetical protein EOP33_08480 [Rickettsiaceae bacterium]|nr:MAG: hypothetical protein EOP33_08480 [Rickettsiaceae bacterium]
MSAQKARAKVQFNAENAAPTVRCRRAEKVQCAAEEEKKYSSLQKSGKSTVRCRRVEKVQFAAEERKKYSSLQKSEKVQCAAENAAGGGRRRLAQQGREGAGSERERRRAADGERVKFCAEQLIARVISCWWAADHVVRAAAQ